MEELLLIIKTEAVVSAISVSLIGVFGVFITARYSVKTAIASKEKQHGIDVDLENRKKAVEIYKKWSNVIKLVMDKNHKKAGKEMADFYQESMCYASQDIISAVLEYKGSINNIDALFKAENILFKMRLDLGLSNQGLKKGELLKLIVTDPQEIDELLNKLNESK